MVESKKQFLKDYIDLHSLDFDMHCLTEFCLDEDIITCEELDNMIYEACYVSIWVMMIRLRLIIWTILVLNTMPFHL